MPGFCLSAVLVGTAILHAAEPAAPDAPVTVEAAPAETAPAQPSAPAPSTDPAPLPNIDLPALTFQGEPAPPQSISEPKATGEAEPTTEASADAPKSEGEAPTETPISEEMIRPTEKKDRSGQKVVAFWFFTTGK